MGDECSKLVTITSDGHHDTLVKALFDFLCDKHGIDYDFRFGGRSIPAHKIILDVFLRPQPPNVDQVDCDLTVDGFTSDTTDRDSLLGSVLEFMYTGTVTIRYGQMERLLEMAKEMGFQMLVEAIEVFKIRQTLAAKFKNARSKTVTKNVAVGEAESTLSRLRPIKSRTESGKVVEFEQDDGSDLTLTETEESEMSSQGESEGSDEKISHDYDSSDFINDEDNEDDKDDDEDWRPNGSANHKPIPAPTLEPNRPAAKNTRLPPQQPLLCGHCDFQTWSSLNFGLHQAEHDPSVVVHKCEMCPQRYLTEPDLLNHVQLVHPEPRQVLQCPHCEYNVRTQDSYIAHMSKHDPSIQVLPCPYCKRRFFTEESLKGHVSRHKPYRCPRCEGFQTMKMTVFYNHLYSAHRLTPKLEPAKMLHCPDCKYKSQNQGMMKCHRLALHSNGIKTYKCPHCDYAAAISNQIGRHIRVNHLNIKRHLCEECGYRTVSQSALAQHKQKHSNLRAYKCPHCGKGFNDKGAMRVHQRVVHEKDGKPYLCHLCSRTFGQRSHLRDHFGKAHDLEVDLSSIPLIRHRDRD